MNNDILRFNKSLKPLIPFNQVYTVKTHKELFRFFVTERLASEDESFRLKHFHVHTELTFVNKGSGFLHIDDEIIPISKGDLILIKSMKPHHVSSDSPSVPLTVTDILFCITTAYNNLSDIISFDFIKGLDSMERDFRIYKKDKFVREISDIMYDIGNNLIAVPKNVSAARADFLLLLTKLPNILTDTGKSSVTLNKKNSAIVSKTIEYVEKHLSEELSLEILAKNAGLAMGHYCTVFKSIMGISPWEYVISERIKLAMKYLAEPGTERAVIDIVGMVGFNNLSNFNKHFKRKTGLSPTEFRNSEFYDS